MQRAIILLAYFFICAKSFSQQYPFVHYTPENGLISNQIKNVYQDSKGRLYFTSVNGLSIYDGSRFINYTSKNGLGFDIVNCIMEMGDDSIWIITNSSKINCFVNGKMKDLMLKENNIVINNLYKNEKGDLYAASEQGLYIFDRDHFIKLPFTDTAGNDISFYLSYIIPNGNYILIQRDNSLLSDQKSPIYLYNTITKKTTAELPNVIAVNKAPDGRIWVSTEKGIMAIDTTALRNGKIVLQELPDNFGELKTLARYYILFDQGGNCWLGDQSRHLIKAASDGTITSFSSTSGLSMFFINEVFMDREGITWIATNNGGLNKLVNSNFSLIENPFGLSTPADISFDENNEQLLYYSQNATLVTVKDDKRNYYKVKNGNNIKKLIETPFCIFGVSMNTVYKMNFKDSVFYPETILTDSIDNTYSNPLVDKNGNFIICGKYNTSAIINAKTIYRKKLNFFADYAVLDPRGNIWVATRAHDLIMYKTNPEDPANYLEQKMIFTRELSAFSTRSIVIDKNENIWIGTRNHGIHVFHLQNGILTPKFILTTTSGLSDNFTTHLTCDADNNIWACSASGLDKITIKNGSPVIENLTKQNNIYQSVYKVIIDKDNIAWGMVSNGLIRISPENKQKTDYSPTLMVSMAKAGKDTIAGTNNAILSYKQNNLIFYFTATSFLDEKQLLYSYRLQGGSNTQWSEPSNNTSVSFIDLHPGDYSLDIKAIFPAGRYPEQIINYKFSISPPWWQTWWFRSLTGIMIIGLLIIGFRFYYRRKLEKQMAILEKQQAIEKERTRIATDMHDDLGAGLSRIKFLSETIGIKKQQQEPIEEDISKIREYSHEMIDKMGEIVWALNEKNDTLSDLLSYTRAYAMEYLSQNGISYKTEIPDNLPPVFVSGEFRRNVFLTIKEALHNVVKHSQATEVTLNIHVNHYLSINLKDDGIGFDKNNTRPFSNGLSNMRSRINEIGGKIEIVNKNGTLINLSIPLNT
jgi:signal transduction histidine kinase/ligand-binding sensor domain-containing protein